MTALRPITALAMTDVVPKAPPTAAPELTWIAPTDVLVDERYQRNLSERSKDLIRRIVAEFDWRRWRPPVCVWGEDGLMAIDGQHSLVAAASHPLVGEVPVLVVAAETLEDRAATFIGINTDRLAVTKMQLHAAAVVAGDPAAVRVQALLDRHGIRVLKSCPNRRQEYRPRETVAVAAIRALIDRRGEGDAEAIVRVLADAECAPIKEVGLRAVERLLFDPEFAGQVETADLVATVAATRDTAEKDGRVFAATHCVPWWHGLAAVWFRKVRKTRPRPVESVSTPRSGALAEPDSPAVRTPGKGDYRAPAPSAAAARPAPSLSYGRELTGASDDRASTVRSARRRADVTAGICGDPPAGRSALDQRRAGGGAPHPDAAEPARRAARTPLLSEA